MTHFYTRGRHPLPVNDTDLPVSSDEFMTKLISQILSADSQEDVKRCIDAAVNTVAEEKTDDQYVSFFIEKMIASLEAFNPMKKEAHQWSNIKIARILFKRIWHQLNAGND